MTQLTQKMRFTHYNRSEFSAKTERETQIALQRLEQELKPLFPAVSYYHQTQIDDEIAKLEPFTALVKAMAAGADVYMCELDDQYAFIMALPAPLPGRAREIVMSHGGPVMGEALERLLPVLMKDCDKLKAAAPSMVADVVEALERAGFEAAGLQKRETLIGGRWQDMLVFERHHPQWQMKLGKEIELDVWSNLDEPATAVATTDDEPVPTETSGSADVSAIAGSPRISAPVISAVDAEHGDGRPERRYGPIFT